MSRRSIDDEEADDDGLFDEDSSDDEDDRLVTKKEDNNNSPSSKTKKRKATGSSKPASKKSKSSSLNALIDDAAEESGEEGGNNNDDEEDDDDEGDNDYVKDGFVVDDDKIEMAERKKQTGDLEDSDDDDSDDDDDGDDGAGGSKLKKGRKFRKFRQHEELADEDLDLIREAQGIDLEKDRLLEEREERDQRKVVARSEEDLRKGLFHDSDIEDDGDMIAAEPKHKIRSKIEHYDEHGMDDFIDDDIGDQHDILASDRAKYAGEDGEGGISQAQMNEASEIFGTDYLDFIAQDEDRDEDEDDELFGKNRYQERGVGVDTGVDSEDVLSDDDDDDDLFGEDDDGDVKTPEQKEALKLKREKRELARKERKKNILAKKIAKQKADLRKQFEPVQLVENFCTDRDDEIRQRDAPERFFDWNVPFQGGQGAGEDITEEEEEEAIWIMQKIPEVQAEFSAPFETMDEVEQREASILQSITRSLRYMHQDKLEPAFIERYRKDTVTSPAVRNNLYRIMDEDGEYNGIIQARDKVKDLLRSVTAKAKKFATATKSTKVEEIDDEYDKAQAKLEKTATEEAQLKEEIEKIDLAIENFKGDNDDDDELFGDNDNDDDEVIT